MTNQFAGTVSKIEPDGNSVVDVINVGNGPLGITTGGGAVWVVNSLDDTVSQIDPEDQSEADKVPVGSGPGDVTWSDGALWVTNESEGTLSKIDAASTEVVDTVDVGGSPAMTAVTTEGLWVAVRDDGDSHRGGAMTILSYGIDSIDPGVAYNPASWELLSVTNDGLVGFKRSGGVEGATLVPNLATSLPTPTDGGREFTFQLRPDIRYSTGKYVQASDVRSSIERTLGLQKAPGSYYGAIRGASACSASHCDLSEGIVVDDTRRTVTFHLEAPDSELLYELALPFASVLPSHTPEATGTRTVPATGPYMIADHEPGRQLELVRNPHFREWSRAAQPQGYADEIVYRFDVESGEQLSQVISGRADLMITAGKQLEEVTTRYPERTTATVEPLTTFLALNTRIPPFNDQRVRRALNYAIDRDRIVDIFGGPTRARETCQLLPPTFPSYEPYCPYTAAPAAEGEWRGPDLERARRLIAASGTKGTRVTVWTARIPDWPPELGDYFVSLVTDLGYVANLKTLNLPRYFTTVGDSRTRAQIIVNGWIADYPAPSAFFEPLLTCDSYIPRDGAGNNNYAAFCDERIDALIARARRLQDDPAAARDLWTRIDAAIVDRAPLVPLVNPRTVYFLSERAKNFQYQAASGVVWEQLWVR